MVKLDIDDHLKLSIKQRKSAGFRQIHEVRSPIGRTVVIQYVKPKTPVLGCCHDPGQVSCACKVFEPFHVLAKAGEAWEESTNGIKIWTIK